MGFAIGVALFYVAEVNESFPYPNGDMNGAEIQDAEKAIQSTVRFQRLLASAAIALGVGSALMLWFQEPWRTKTFAF